MHWITELSLVLFLAATTYAALKGVNHLSEITDLVGSIAASVDNLAEDVNELVGKLPAEGGMTAEQVAELKAGLEAVATKAASTAAIYQNAGESPSEQPAEG